MTVLVPEWPTGVTYKTIAEAKLSKLKTSRFPAANEWLARRNHLTQSPSTFGGRRS